MASVIKVSDVDVVILCGGKGQRLRPAVKDRPKPMAQINSKPFLDILIDYAAGFGFKRFILCSGYKGGFIRDYYSSARPGLEIILSQEKKPLGTAGAVKNAQNYIKSQFFLVLNGDSFCAIGLDKFLKFHKARNAFISIAITRAVNKGDCGNVCLNSSGRLTGFAEKIKNTESRGFINCGIYLFSEKVLSLIPAGKKFSIEKDLFPGLINEKIYGYITKEKILDIGTPERYKRAQSDENLIRHLNNHKKI